MSIEPAEPTWRRDVGPFEDSVQTMRQYEALMFGVPGEVVAASGSFFVVADAVGKVGLRLTEHEQSVISSMSPEAAVIAAGLILRAHWKGLGRLDAEA